MQKPFSIPLVSNILFHQRAKTVQEKLIVVYIWALMVCWGHFNASLIARYLNRNKSNISRQMKKRLRLHSIWQGMIRRDTLEKIREKGWLVIDSIIKGKRGQKLHNLQKFKTTHG